MLMRLHAQRVQYSVSGETGGYPCTIINDIFVVKRECKGRSMISGDTKGIFLQVANIGSLDTVAATLEDYDLSKKLFKRYSHSCDIEKKKIRKSWELNFVSFLVLETQ
jgi:hypothetical protein